MKVVIAGATGFIGRSLVRHLSARGDAVVVLSRSGSVRSGIFPEGVRVVRWDGTRQGVWSGELDGADAVVNLAGASIGGGRWTAARKELLIRSRTDPTNALVQACLSAVRPPGVFLNASAVGYYHHEGDAPVTEQDPPGIGFLSDVAQLWEGAARGAASRGIRLVIARIGVVIGKGGGALERMLLPFRLFVGGPLGSGKQWFPWVHVDDVVGAMVFMLDTASMTGPVNVVAPEPVTMAAFSKRLGGALHRPSWLSVPAFALRVLLGEMSVIILGGRPVVPLKLLESGYGFLRPRLDQALRSAV
ncbi:MAG: TIGR01777 family protein [Ignavibacteriae bacterium]|nr:TIGR01777 family protein [Ignavibacteriota bacterium]